MADLSDPLEFALNMASTYMSFLLTLATFFLVGIFSYMLKNKKPHLPPGIVDVPGPLGIPIFGNLFQLGAEPYLSFCKWAERFGDVVRIKLGSRTVIVLNGTRAIHQALIKQSIVFSGRPNLSGFLSAIEINGGSVAFSSYDESWKIHRRIAENAVRYFTSGKQSVHVEHHVTHEAKELIKFVMKGKERVIMDPSKLLKLSVSNVMAGMIFQERHNLDHEDVRGIVNELERVIDSIGGSNKADFLPWLGVLVPSLKKDYQTFTTQLRDILTVHIDKHLENYESGMDTDILYYLMTLAENLDPKQKAELNLTDERVRSTIIDFFRAGYETVATTLLWAFLYAIYYPEIQQEIREEIDEVVGRGRLPCITDRGNLPLTEAFLAEVSRHASVVATTVPHSTINDTVLGGGYNYFIPKDVVVMVNLYSIHHDPKMWDEPEKFDPRRFLSKDGAKLDTDKVNSLMRFGAGRRKCVGIEIAQMELFLFFTIIIHQCFLKNVEGQELSLQRKGSLLVMHPVKYEMEMTQR